MKREARGVGLPSIALLFGCMEGDAALLPVTRKLAGKVSDTPNDTPLMSLGLNFFLHEGARRKFLSSSCSGAEGLNKGCRSACVYVRVCERITSSILLSVPKASRLLYSRSRVALAYKDHKNTKAISSSSSLILCSESTGGKWREAKRTCVFCVGICRSKAKVLWSNMSSRASSAPWTPLS